MSIEHRARMPNRKNNDRRGAVLIAALVCLSIVLAILGGMLLGALRRGRELHTERDHRQCELLLQSGIDRAAYRLTKEPSYHGETWALESSEIADRGAGLVTITTSGESAQNRQVEVVAEYPAGDEFSIRRSRSITIQLKKQQPEE